MFVVSPEKAAPAGSGTTKGTSPTGNTVGDQSAHHSVDGSPEAETNGAEAEGEALESQHGTEVAKKKKKKKKTGVASPQVALGAAGDGATHAGPSDENKEGEGGVQVREGESRHFSMHFFFV